MFRSVLQRVLHRIAYTVPGGTTLRPWLHRVRGVAVGKDVWISRLVYIDELHPEAVSIGDHSTIGLRTSIFTHFYWGGRRSAGHAGPVTIGREVFIGPHCVILPNVRIGDGSVIKAGTVVTRNVPPRTLWGPVPAGPLARVTIPLTAEHEYAEFVGGLKPVRPPMPTSTGGGREPG